MRVSVDISLYPLDKDFVQPINDVIERLQAHDSIKIFINPMAAQLVGEYDDIIELPADCTVASYGIVSGSQLTAVVVPKWRIFFLIPNSDIALSACLP